jgi:hypothetical protein
MLEITLGLAVVLVVLAVPRLRSAFLSFMGLAAIIAAGSAVIAVVVWALYQAKPWLTPEQSATTEDESVPEEEVADTSDLAEKDLAAALASEDARLQAQQQQKLEEEKLRIARLVGRARYILEEDRKFAEQAALDPLAFGAGSRFDDIIVIRIPAWRDRKLAERQAESIRTWLQSIGLTADETANISTAKAWGSLYDMWVAEERAGTAPSPPAGESAVASGPAGTEVGGASEPVHPIETEPAFDVPAEIVSAPPPVVRQTRRVAPRVPPVREVVRSPTLRRASPPRRPPPRRPPRREREVGPFGY